MNLTILISLVLIMTNIKAENLESDEKNSVFHIALEGEGKITLDWMLDYSKEEIWFEIHLPKENFGWFALGFSNRGELYPADYYILWSDYKSILHLQDSWSDEKGVIHLDTHQDCNNFNKKITESRIKFVFSRKFDTCDEDDYIIKDDTTHIVWSKGSERLHHLSGLNISTDVKNNGMQRTQLLKNTHVSTKLPEHVEKFEIKTNKTQVPPNETTYWCHVHKLPDRFRNKHHILQYEPAIEHNNEGLVHHMEMFHCIAPVDKEIPIYVGDCFGSERPEATKVCKRVLAAWAMGAKAFIYPQEAALPIGGPNFNLYVMLEVHYNNPQQRKGVVDSSGIRFYITKDLRPYDAGVVELGLEYTDKMAIPPNQNHFPLSGYCVSECTAVSLPPDGIIVFGSQLHTHLTGIEVVTRHFRDGIELNELNRDTHYSTHFQEIRRLKRLVKVLPGDALITTCWYNTEDRKNVTLGGFAISDEMCVNYVHYYPASDLEVCKSAISENALSTFFQYLHDWENMATSKSNGISDNYRAIEWNRLRVQLLRDVYGEAPLSAQCNMSSGDRFPGYWENTPLTYISKPLPPPIRKCIN